MPSNTIHESVVNAACEAAWPEFRSHLEGQQAWSDADPSRQNRLRLIVIQALTAAQARVSYHLSQLDDARTELATVTLSRNEFIRAIKEQAND